MSSDNQTLPGLPVVDQIDMPRDSESNGAKELLPDFKILPNPRAPEELAEAKAQAYLDENSYIFYEASEDDFENIQKYRPGGYHPVELGDHYNDGRYRVLHKLGAGGFSTVWLTRDLKENRYVALKVIVAKESDNKKELNMLQRLTDIESDHIGKQYVGGLLDHFYIDGPNGHHLCMVLPLTGPNSRTMSGDRCRLKPHVARSVSWKATQALAFLHSQGICHGDLTPSNIVFKLSNVDDLSEDEIYETFGRPKTESLHPIYDDVVGPHAPRLIVRPIDFQTLESELFTDDIFIIDFGVAYLAADAKKEGLLFGIPLPYLSPERLFKLEADMPSDVWALACSIYTLRSGRILFDMSIGSSLHSLLFTMASILGPPPGDLRYYHLDYAGMPIKKDKQNNVYDHLDDIPLHDIVSEIRDQQHPDRNPSRYLRASKYFWREFQSESFEVITLDSGVQKVIDFEETEDWSEIPISSAEAQSLLSLLKSLLVYDEKERPTAEELLEKKHAWFDGRF